MGDRNIRASGYIRGFGSRVLVPAMDTPFQGWRHCGARREYGEKDTDAADAEFRV